MRKRLCNILALIAISFAFLFLLSGCIRFSNPIIGYSDAVFDSSLVGLWQENTD